MLKGVHSSKKTLANGKVERYYYAWKNGPRIKAQPGTDEFAQEYYRLVNERKPRSHETVGALVEIYSLKQLPTLSAATQRSYRPFLNKIEKKFGSMPFAAVEELGSRQEFENWRDTMVDRPRTADLAWTVLKLLFSYATEKEMLKRNPCLGGGRMAKAGTRKDIIWTDEEIAALSASAPQQIADALLLAQWTGQRQGDLLALSWANYDGTHIRLKQSKGGRRVTVKVSSELKDVLDARRAVVASENSGMDISDLPILTNSRGERWTSDGFRTSWGKVVAKTSVKGKTFHDLRGTFITSARRAGASIDDIAMATGHSTKEVRSVLETHYMADDEQVRDAVIIKMERNSRRTKPSN
ncbi:tyrosine-type recombinase/integrase [Shinella sp. H4-D48]|uniref:tyrosine-type recombinase/integrase n=1 Tax=Shinella sp. H4-D48 TaxID=2925841 RepID=UPI001F53D076|nr:tyrosine-type recombinase/integrase [Shinella sp. H4-D48]UNK39325.1 tyrosine-type recombinase/integrase [Shinella sp. H4-D48]